MDPETLNIPVSQTPPEEKEISENDKIWILHFTFASWFILTFLFFSGEYKNILFKQNPAKYAQRSSGEKTLIETEQNDQQKPVKPSNLVGEASQQGVGDNLPAQGATDNLLQYAKKGVAEGLDTRSLRLLESKNEDAEELRVRMFEFAEKGSNGKNLFGDKPETTLSGLIQNNKEFHFSWDRNGKPVLPASKIEHYEYFKQMIKKVQFNWSPPGGVPHPIYSDTYHSSSYVPGRSTFQPFPAQKIYVFFQVKKNGDIVNAQVIESLDYESLDTACVESITRSQNFGPPPEELLQGEAMPMILVFPIMGVR